MTFLRILIQHVDELLNMMSVLTGDKRFEDAQNTYDKKEGKNKKRGTVKNMFLYEYDEEKHKKFLFEEGYAAGEKSGVELGKILVYHELGISLDEISKKLNIDECTVKEIIKKNI